MGLRFHKALRLLPGVRVNVSKSGLSLSLGGKGVTCNVTPKGSRMTVGVPGTGLSYSTSRQRSVGRFAFYVLLGLAAVAWFYVQPQR